MSGDKRDLAKRLREHDIAGTPESQASKPVAEEVTTEDPDAEPSTEVPAEKPTAEEPIVKENLKSPQQLKSREMKLNL